MSLSMEIITSAGDFGSTGEFYWESSGLSIGPHVNWAENEPNGINNTQNCIRLKNSGMYQWEDVTSLYNAMYICESTINN
jgi:hypothetical protein